MWTSGAERRPFPAMPLMRASSKPPAASEDRAREVRLRPRLGRRALALEAKNTTRPASSSIALAAKPKQAGRSVHGLGRGPAERRSRSRGRQGVPPRHRREILPDDNPPSSSIWPGRWRSERTDEALAAAQKAAEKQGFRPLPRPRGLGALRCQALRRGPKAYQN